MSFAANPAEELLTIEAIEIPEEFQANARRLLYYQNFQAALPFDNYLEKHNLRGFVRFKRFDVSELHPERSPTIRAIMKGLEQNKQVFEIEHTSGSEQP